MGCMFFKKKKTELREDLQSARSDVKIFGQKWAVNALNDDLLDDEKVISIDPMNQGKTGGVACLTDKRFLFAQKLLQGVDVFAIPLSRVQSVHSKNTMVGEQLTISTANQSYSFTSADRQFTKQLQNLTV